jgi:hypothetical protein
MNQVKGLGFGIAICFSDSFCKEGKCCDLCCIGLGCSKQCFEVVDRTDEVSNHTYSKVKLTWFEEIFEKD